MKKVLKTTRGAVDAAKQTIKKHHLGNLWNWGFKLKTTKDDCVSTYYQAKKRYRLQLAKAKREYLKQMLVMDTIKAILDRKEYKIGKKLFRGHILSNKDVFGK